MGPAFASADDGTSWQLVDLGAAVSQLASSPGKLRALGLGLWEGNASLDEWQLIFPKDERARVVLSGDHGDPQFAFVPHPIAFAESTTGRLSVAASDDSAVKLFVRAAGGDSWVKERDLDYRPSALVSVGETLFAIDPLRGIVNVRNDQVILLSKGTTQIVSAHGSAFAITGDADDDPLAGATELWHSLDGGHTFSKRTPALRTAVGHSAPRIVSIAVAANRTGHVLASFKAGDRFGVAASEDAGTSFKVLFTDSDGSPAENVADPWIAERFGPSWADAPLGLATSDERIVATDYGRVILSRDSGRSWSGTYSARTTANTLATTGINSTTVYGVHVDPFDRSRAILASADIGGFVSEDAALTWTPCEGVPREWRNTMYWAEFDPHVRGRVLAAVSGTHDLPRPKMWRRQSPLSFRGGVVHSEDGGRSWHSRARGVPNAAVTHLLADPASGKRGEWFACVFGHGIFRSTDGGEMWIQASEGLPSEPLVWSLSRAKDGTLYAVVSRRAEGDDAAAGAVFTSSNNAMTWRPLALPPHVTGPTSIIADPERPLRLVLSAWGWHHPERNTRGGIFVSDDGGGSWRRVLSRDGFVFSVTRDPNHSNRIYAAGFSGTAWRSEDAGDTFLPIRGFGFKNAHRVFADLTRDGYIYIATFGAGLWHGRGDTDAHAKTLTEEMPRRRTV
jgi:photosystem II stability/assembly factor-like uncharacterized protein